MRIILIIFCIFASNIIFAETQFIVEPHVTTFKKSLEAQKETSGRSRIAASKSEQNNSWQNTPEYYYTISKNSDLISSIHRLMKQSNNFPLKDYTIKLSTERNDVRISMPNPPKAEKEFFYEEELDIDGYIELAHSYLKSSGIPEHEIEFDFHSIEYTSCEDCMYADKHISAITISFRRIISDVIVRGGSYATVTFLPNGILTRLEVKWPEFTPHQIDTKIMQKMALNDAINRDFSLFQEIKSLSNSTEDIYVETFHIKGVAKTWKMVYDENHVPILIPALSYVVYVNENMDVLHQVRKVVDIPLLSKK